MGEPWGGPELCPECDHLDIDYADRGICSCGYVNPDKFPEQACEHCGRLLTDEEIENGSRYHEGCACDVATDMAIEEWQLGRLA